MKQLWNGLLIAFGMYSAIPTPMAEWNDRNMKYTLCFFPVVGAVIGGAVCLWSWLALHFHWDGILLGAGITLLPILLSGGIHVDGFCDTMDALASNQPPERKQQILKDSNVGAFALIGLCCWMLGYFALASQLPLRQEMVGVLALGFVLSRCGSAFSIVTFPCCPSSSLARTFADGSHRRRVRVVVVTLAALCVAGMLALSLPVGAAAAAAALVAFVYYRWMSQREFGGITGDLAGFFLQMCELAVLAAVVLVGGLTCG
ncbi:MAG: adenosylcobinamide-GDP ribazoletransferase [Eubacteriales bacterium]|jgi:adenosylcobinamide-GDP ribazoletransferase